MTKVYLMGATSGEPRPSYAKCCRTSGRYCCCEFAAIARGWRYLAISSQWEWESRPSWNFKWNHWASYLPNGWIGQFLVLRNFANRRPTPWANHLSPYSAAFAKPFLAKSYSVVVWEPPKFGRTTSPYWRLPRDLPHLRPRHPRLLAAGQRRLRVFPHQEAQRRIF